MARLVSVIIPIYNTVGYLARCVQSVLSQSYSDIEVLLIDDGSTDGSRALADSFSKKDARCRCFHKENGGVSTALNVGLAEAKGEFIAFVDSDDYVSAECIKNLLIRHDGTNADVVCCNFPHSSEGILDACSFWRQFPDNQLFSVSRCAKLFDAGLFKKYRFPVGKVAEDVNCARMLFRGNIKIATSSRQDYLYTTDRLNSYTHNHSLKDWESIISEWVGLYELFMVLFPMESFRLFPWHNACEYYFQLRAAYPDDRAVRQRCKNQLLSVSKKKWPMKDKLRYWRLKYLR